MIVHHRSYMKEVSPVVCSAAVLIYCLLTGSSCKCAIAEKSPSSGSYCGETLGTILTQLNLRAAVQGCMGPYPVIIDDCDNDGVVKHGNVLHQTISLMQTQSDVPRVMKQYIIRQPFRLKFLYVASHCDDTKLWSDCTLKERMIIKVDSLANLALMCAHATNKYFDGIFSDKDFRILVNNGKVTGPIRPAMEDHWGKEAGRHFLDKKQIIPSLEFNYVWWQGMKMAMDSYPKMFRIFITKAGIRVVWDKQ